MLLGLPSLWRKVEIDTVFRDPPEVIHYRLERRLHHSKGVTLNVTLTNTLRTLRPEESHYIDLFKKLAKLGPIERWHSLSLFDYYNQGEIPLHEIFMGAFVSLRALFIHGYSHSATSPGPHSNLFKAILQSKLRLQHLGLNTYFVPFDLKPLLQLQSIMTLYGTLRSLNMVPYDAFPDLHQVTINGSFGLLYGESPSKIPPRTPITLLRFSPALAMRIDAENISILWIERFSGWEGSEFSLELPNLHTLHIRPCAPYMLQAFKAPKVEILKLLKMQKKDESMPLKLVRKATRASTYLLFRWNRQRLTVYPTSLSIDMEEITQSTFLVILKYWPQLERLSLVLGGDFDCFGRFAEQLLHKETPLCPQLEEIEMEVWWYVKSRNWRMWREVAKNMMLARKHGPLKTIAWRNRWFNSESVIQEN
ncbi:hypothetical protein FRC19_007864 [Serendipita sp. 401]|nr:hypothetical protein FRC19_007864 [Serendipita sp. 401]KAG9020077.1 hypothetical protein FS842_007606 [Serendipita sp. 407]